MQITVYPVEYREVEPLRELCRQELNCQIIRDSFLPRGFADPYLITVDARIAAYGAVANKYDKGRLIEFYTFPSARDVALPMFRELLVASRATHIEAQTNAPLMLLMLNQCATNISPEKILFEDVYHTHLVCPSGAVFRRSIPEESQAIFAHQHEPVGDWVIDADGKKVVATGGFLTHYNPPYGDIFMEVDEAARLQGYGSYLIQELKRVCYQAGKKPSARCDLGNVASRKTLQRAGLLPCGHLVVSTVAPSNDSR